MSRVDRWLAAVDVPGIDARVMAKLSDVLRISERYLLGIDPAPTQRVLLLPDERFLIERYRNLPPAAREDIVATVLDRHSPY